MSDNEIAKSEDRYHRGKPLTGLSEWRVSGDGWLVPRGLSSALAAFPGLRAPEARETVCNESQDFQLGIGHEEGVAESFGLRLARHLRGAMTKLNAN